MSGNVIQLIGGFADSDPAVYLIIYQQGRKARRTTQTTGRTKTTKKRERVCVCVFGSSCALTVAHIQAAVEHTDQLVLCIATDSLEKPLERSPIERGVSFLFLFLFTAVNWLPA